MAPSKPSPNLSTDTFMSVRPTYSSPPQYLAESDHNRHRLHSTLSSNNQIPSLDCLPNSIDQDPFFADSSWDPSRFENEFGRLHSPSLSSAHFTLPSYTNLTGTKGPSATGNGGTDPSTAVASTDHLARDFETAFCRDFYCCGTTLCDLHDLLQHYEECHVRFEEEDDDDDDEYNDTDDAFGSGLDSECCDEDSWSETDSLPSSPSTTSPLPPPMLRLDGTLSSGSSSNANGTAAARGNQRSSVFDHHRNQHHYRHNHRHYSSSSNYSRHLNADNPSLTTHALEVISATFGVPTKRKAVVSLADLYVEDDLDDNSSAFGNTILRTSSSSNRSNASITMNELLLRPLMKRQAFESNRYAATSEHPFSTRDTLAGTFPGTVLGGDGKPIGPLIGTSNHRSMFPGGSIIPTASCFNDIAHPSAAATAATATQDWMRQRDQVFSIFDDMTKTPLNISDENKPYRCTVPGCDKTYKNPNGLKYHNQHGHSSPGPGDADNPETRPYVCTFLECGKRYKNLNGLKYHIEHTHPNMIAALKAHQAALMTNSNPLADGAYMNHQTAAMTIAAALATVEASPMMAMAANAILTSHATAAAVAATAVTSTATTATESASDTGSTLANFTHVPLLAGLEDVREFAG
ncbi:hypothetical protein BGX27_010413 [Mortierella sp. AM989]|nr:hypothetical protein BGX27_010413 [Mortierella sp. AM989]